MKKKLLALLLAAVMAAALMSTAFALDIAAVITSNCGDNLTWSYSNGVLTIQGTGRIYDYGELQDIGGYALHPKPWADYEDQLRTVNIGYGVTGIGSAAFSPSSWAVGSALTSVTIPSSVTYIGDYAFYFCKNLTDVVIPDSVTSIGMNAFDGCSSLKSVVIPNGVTVIEQETFFECTGLTGVVIPDGVTKIGHDAFYGCTSLTSVTIPDGITTISEGTFLNCSGLTSVTIPASVTTIGGLAFTGCDSLKDVYYGGTESQWKQVTIETSEFGNNDALTKAAIHYGGGTTTPPEEVPSFTDVPDWCAVGAGWAAQKGITTGTNESGTTFTPDRPCTEAEIVTFLYRAAGKQKAASSSPFIVESYYQDAVDWAYEQGLIDINFKPDALCTRSTTVLYIWQACGSDTSSASGSSFTDVPSGAAYADAVSWAVANGITTGTNDSGTTFSPNMICSRGQIVTFLYRAYA